MKKFEILLKESLYIWLAFTISALMTVYVIAFVKFIAKLISL